MRHYIRTPPSTPQELVPATTISTYDSGPLETILVHARASDDEFTTEGYGANHEEVM